MRDSLFWMFNITEFSVSHYFLCHIFFAGLRNNGRILMVDFEKQRAHICHMGKSQK